MKVASFKNITVSMKGICGLQDFLLDCTVYMMKTLSFFFGNNYIQVHEIFHTRPSPLFPQGPEVEGTGRRTGIL